MTGTVHRDGGRAFDRLPGGVRGELADRGYDRAFFATASPRLRRTVLNVYAKLAAFGLWEFVGRESRSVDGCLQFRCPDLAGLRAALVRLGFTPPRDRDGRWECRERRALCPLHVKHFDGWPTDRVQAHIDVFGAVTRAHWWLFPPAPAGLLVLHLLTTRSYLWQDLIARLLLRQGFDPRVISP